MKHVLRAIPSYHLMALSLNQQGYKKLKKACTILLWGWNENGKENKALIAWEEITWPRAEWGLDSQPFRQQSHALKMQHISQIIEGQDRE